MSLTRIRKLAPYASIICTPILLLSLARPLFAIDGVVLINQQAALSGGVIAGDSAGFPVTIGAPGSYRLTSDLDLRGQLDSANLVAIFITASDVTVDLNGFSILGPTVCSGSPPAGAVSCIPSGSGRGVYSAIPARSIVVRNGAISGMSATGVYVRGALVEDLRLSHNDTGALVLDGIVTGCSLWSNRVAAQVGSAILSENTAYANNEGFADIQASVAVANVSSNNHLFGFDTILSSAVHENIASGNGDDGFNAAGGFNSIVANAAFSNGGDGFVSGASSLVVDNVARSNGAYAVSASSLNAIYSNNVFTGNNGGAELQVSGGTTVNTNVCGTNTTCP